MWIKSVKRATGKLKVENCLSKHKLCGHQHSPLYATYWRHNSCGKCRQRHDALAEFQDETVAVALSCSAVSSESINSVFPCRRLATSVPATFQ